MWYRTAAFVHILATAVWLGGMVFIAAVLVPLTRSKELAPGTGARLLRMMAPRLRLISWITLTVLVVSGVGTLLSRGINPLAVFTRDGTFYELMRIKVGLVAALLALSALHDFVLGPRLARQLEAARVSRLRKATVWLARLNLLVTLTIVAVGVLMLRGLP